MIEAVLAFYKRYEGTQGARRLEEAVRKAAGVEDSGLAKEKRKLEERLQEIDRAVGTLLETVSATARAAVESWTARPQNEAAVTVPVPQGGWDAAPAQQSLPQAPAPVKRSPSGAGGPYRPVPQSAAASQ